MLTCGHPAVAVADAEAAAELAKEEHELGRTSAREGRKARRTWRRWKMQRKRKTMRHDLRHQTNVAPFLRSSALPSRVSSVPKKVWPVGLPKPEVNRFDFRVGGLVSITCLTDRFSFL